MDLGDGFRSRHARACRGKSRTRHPDRDPKGGLGIDAFP